MAELSIVLGYRDRDIERVRECLDSLAEQTFSDFEVIFVDFGSSDFFAQSAKTLVSKYSFAKYIYNHTSGRPWSRSHALNSGVRSASGRYVLLADIDLVFSPQVLQGFYNNAAENRVVYTKVYFAPQGYRDWSCWASDDLDAMRSSTEMGRGISLVSKTVFEKIRGYDEYYCYWGIEDNDLYERVSKLHIKEYWLDLASYPVIHQAHAVKNHQQRNFFPEKWWEDMNIHFKMKSDDIERNDGSWGRLLLKQDRIIAEKKEVAFIYDEKGTSSYKALFIRRLIDDIKRLKRDECLVVTVRKDSPVKAPVLRLFNKILRKIYPSYTVSLKCHVDRERLFNPFYDPIYIVWKIIKEYALIEDYSIEENTDEIRIKICR